MKYKNITTEDLILVGIGTVNAGEVVELPENFHNVNFEKVEKRKEDNKNKED
jgi:hypothetical protein